MRLLLLLLKCNLASFVFSDIWIWFLTEAFRFKFLDYIFWFSNFWARFFLLTELNITLFIMLAKFFPVGGPVFYTALKSLAISLMRSSSSLCSDSESSLLMAKLTFGLLVASTSRSIWSSKSKPSYKDSSSSAGGWLSPACQTNFSFVLKFVVQVSFFFFFLFHH